MAFVRPILIPSHSPLTLPFPGSPVCFILASFNHPGAIKSTWGRTSDEISSETWDMLNAPAQSHGGVRALGLGLLVKMTRLEDLGLDQLCLPDVDFDGYDSDSGYY